MKSNTIQRDKDIESSHNDDIKSIEEIEPIDKRFSIYLSTQTRPTKQTEQQHRFALATKEQKESTPIDSKQATAMLHPLLEDNILTCPHNGIVKLKSNKGKNFKSNNIPMILESDLLHSPILGCTNNIAGVPTPCTQVALILPSTRALKKYNNDYPIMQDLVSSGVMSDTGFPLIATPKPNTFRINSPHPSNAATQDKEALIAAIRLTKPNIRLHYKEHAKQADNIPLCKLSINDNLQESNRAFRLLELDIYEDSKDLQDKDLKTHLQASYPKDYEFKEIDITIGIHFLALIFIIPQKIPKIFKEAYKNYEFKDYGVGRFQYLDNYHNTIVKEKKIMLYRVLYAPAKLKKVEIEIACGLDNAIEEKESVLKILLVNETLRTYDG